MPGTHNFLPFDSTNANMTPDASYSTDANRINGVSNGVADPFSFNKAVHQGSIMAAAIAQMAANNGQSFDDTNLSNLITAIANVFATLSTTAYADRVAHALLGAADIGALSFCAAQSTPSAATYTAAGTGNLLGGYHYREVFVTGYNNPDGTHYVRGFSPATQRSGYDVSPSSQQVSVTNLPTGGAGCIGRAIYRSAANGVAGSEKFCGIIWDNTTTVYTDNLVDSQLGTGMPTVQGTSIPANVPISNTTGTTVPIPTAAQVGALPQHGWIPDNTDIHSMMTPGIWMLNTWTSSIQNRPPLNDWGTFTVLKSESGYVSHVFVSETGIRVENYDAANSAWNSWFNPADGCHAASADYASDSVALTSFGLRNNVISSSAPSGGSDGDTWDQV